MSGVSPTNPYYHTTDLSRRDQLIRQIAYKNAGRTSFSPMSKRAFNINLANKLRTNARIGKAPLPGRLPGYTR